MNFFILTWNMENCLSGMKLERIPETLNIDIDLKYSMFFFFQYVPSSPHAQTVHFDCSTGSVLSRSAFSSWELLSQTSTTVFYNSRSAFMLCVISFEQDKFSIDVQRKCSTQKELSIRHWKEHTCKFCYCSFMLISRAETIVHFCLPINR